MKTAIYVRVSTGLQATEGTSLDGQIELCIKKAKELNINENEIIVFREEGKSGEDIDRPEMNRLRREISLGNIKRIIITHPDRLSRDMTDKLIVCREFEKYNIELIFVDTEYHNTPEGQLFFNMQSAIAQYELAQIKKRTMRGRLNAVKNRNQIMPMGSPPFGYDYKNGKLIINKEEAKFVKMIYEWYVYEKLTIRQIGTRLHELGVKPKKSNNWNASSILKILSSEIYIGNYYYNQTKNKKLKGEKTKSGNPKIVRESRPKNEWVKIDVPKIIDENLFQLVQNKKSNNKIKNKKTKHQYLLKGLLRCGECGHKWQSTFKTTGKKDNKKYFYYRCSHRTPKTYGEKIKKCSTPSIPCEELNNHVWNYVYNVITNPKVILENYNEMNDTKDIEDMINILEKQIEQKNEEKNKVKIMFRRDIISEEEMIHDIKEINEKINKLQKENEKYKNQLSNSMREKETAEFFNNLISRIRKKLSNNNNISFEEKRNIIEQLIDEIIIIFDKNNDGVRLRFTGNISNLSNNDDGIHCSQHIGNINNKYHKNLNQFIPQSNFKLIQKRSGYKIMDKPKNK